MPRSWLLSTWGLLIHMLVNIFQVQIILSHQLFLQVSKTITRLHLTVTQGQIWGLFSCVEKLKYQTLPIAPHAPACGATGSPMHLVGAQGCFSSNEWAGSQLRVGTMVAQRVCSPPHFSEKKPLLDNYLSGVTFWNQLKRAYLIISISQKLLKSQRLCEEKDFSKLNSMHIIVKSLQSCRPALWVFSDLISQRKAFRSCKYLVALIKSKSEISYWTRIGYLGA